MIGICFKDVWFPLENGNIIPVGYTNYEMFVKERSKWAGTYTSLHTAYAAYRLELIHLAGITEYPFETSDLIQRGLMDTCNLTEKGLEFLSQIHVYEK